MLWVMTRNRMSHLRLAGDFPARASPWLRLTIELLVSTCHREQTEWDVALIDGEFNLETQHGAEDFGRGAVV